MKLDNLLPKDDESETSSEHNDRTMGSRAGGSERHYQYRQSQTAHSPNSATRPSRQAPLTNATSHRRRRSLDDGTNETHKGPRSHSTLRPDIETGTKDRLSTTEEGRNGRRNKHYHHRKDPPLTGHKRHPTGKWKPGCHPDDKQKGSDLLSSIKGGLSSLLGLDQTSIQESWGTKGPDEKPQAGGSYIV